jgi:nitrite reductase (NADH) small subunit/3-phenylpropionate/trans-cinnamate dioxygenase ferredoxin subunit
MDDFVKVASVEAVDEAGVLVVEHCARRIAIYREGDGYFAVEDICPHMGAFLSRGFRKSGIIICPWHNWVFELQSGLCLSNNTGVCVETFPVQVINGDILLPALPTDETEESFWE